MDPGRGTQLGDLLPLDTQIGGVAIDATGGRALRVRSDRGQLLVAAASSGPVDVDVVEWSGSPVAPGAFEVTRHRVEVNMIDAPGRALPLYPVTVAVAQGSSAVDLWAGGQTYSISSTQSAELTTDSMGKLTLGVLTTAGLGAANLVVSADQLVPTSVQPAVWHP